jgi:serine/threonine protein kinase
MSSAGTDLSGTTLDGRYMLVRRLGEGAMGTVYVANHHTLDQPVAVKMLHPWLAAEPKHRERFMREARAASRIEHPNVVELLEVGTTPEGSVYLVMELLQGHDLRAILRRDGPLPWARARHYLLQATAALREAHRQGVIHRDIKPANCFVCDADDGRAERMKLLDFGIAKLGEDPSASQSSSAGKRLTQTGELVGTLAYLAPEFAEGKPASVFTDMYALGIMAYELLTGDVPFRGKNEFQVLARHLNEPPVRPRMLVPTLPEAAEALVLTLLAKRPELRFESMEDVEHALMAIAPDGSDGGASLRRENSGPLVVRRRDASGPHREGSGPRREGSGPRRQAGMPIREREEGAPRRDGAPARVGSGPWVSSEDEWIWGREHSEAIELVRAPPPRPRNDAEAIAQIEGSSGSLDLVRRRQWGTIATVVLLALLLGAGIASLLLRQ